MKRDRCRWQRNATATLRSVNFFTGLRVVNGATPAKLFQISTVRFRGQEPTSLAEFLGRAGIFDVVNLCGSRFFRRSEGRDVIVCVNREGVHNDTIHHSFRTKSQVYLLRAFSTFLVDGRETRTPQNGEYSGKAPLAAADVNGDGGAVY